MPLLIKNGTVVTASETKTADILCEGETITAIGTNLDAPADAEIIDATGKYVFPGFIDPHVHIYLPFMGTFSKDDYESASKAALIGGTTTLIEMCCPSREDDPLEAFEQWFQAFECRRRGLIEVRAEKRQVRKRVTGHASFRVERAEQIGEPITIEGQPIRRQSTETTAAERHDRLARGPRPQGGLGLGADCCGAATRVRVAWAFALCRL
jgi:hypothetical protein